MFSNSPFRIPLQCTSSSQMDIVTEGGYASALLLKVFLTRESWKMKNEDN